MHHQKQPTPREELNQYPIRILVAGSRNFSDYEFFSETMRDYVAQFTEPFVFISGAASTGADALIIRWCRENDYPWVEFPADWDNVGAPGAVIRFRNGRAYNVRAGFQRNADMGRVATNLIAWWDGRSSGTRDMISIMRGRGDDTATIVLIDTDKE